MESSKRTRLDSKIYNERRSYTKKPKLHSESIKKSMPVNALIFDNGAYTIKLGYNKDEIPIALPNHVIKAKSERKRAFIADQIEDCRDLSGLYYIMPHEKGYITKYDVQKTIWDYVFNKYPIHDNTVMMTQPIFNFKTIQEYTDEIFFEEYDVKALFKANPTDYVHYELSESKDTPSLVVDSGYSFTHIVPYIKGKKYGKGIIRLNIGGKLLTNYLKDILSYRQLHVMEETYVINQLKEDVCYMSNNFMAEMERAKRTKEIVQSYVLPDFHNIRRGYVHETGADQPAENCQVLRLNNERITIPEVMIRPSIISGMNVAGLAECIAQSVKNCPLKYQGALCNNVLFVGGNSQFKGFRERLAKETRILLPCEYNLSIRQPDDPVNCAWQGAKTLSRDPALKSQIVTKREYEEEGSAYTIKKFNKYAKVDEDPPKIEPNLTKPFSYLNYWKNEGMDIMRKDPDVVNTPVQFKLEGDNIEEYDGKHVVIEFEYENDKAAKETNLPAETEEVTTTIAEESNKTFKRKRTTYLVQQPSGNTITFSIATSTTTTTTVTTTPSTSKMIQAGTVTTSNNLQLIKGVTNLNKIITLAPNILNANIVLPKLTKIPQKVFQPIVKQISGTSTGSPQQKYPQLISLRNTVNLSDAVIVKSTAAGTTPITKTTSILNNAVIVPQKMLSSKNLTFQIIPIRPDMMCQGNIILSKKQQ